MKRREGVWLVEHKAKVPICSLDREWAPRFSRGIFETEGEALRGIGSLPQGTMNYRSAFYVPATPKQPKPTVTRKVKRNG